MPGALVALSSERSILVRFLFSYLIYGCRIVYYHTIGRVVFEVQHILIVRKNKRSWDAYVRKTRRAWDAYYRKYR